MSMRKWALAAAMIAAVAVPAAYAAGMWSTLPMVGSAAFCGAVVGSGPAQAGQTGQGAGTPPGTIGAQTYCAQNIPAGPAALTGSEVIPADTLLPGGAAPQTVVIPANLFASGGIQVVTANTSLTIANGISTLVSNQTTATIAAITLPSAPMNNQVVRIANAGSGVLTITAINANTGQSIVQGTAPTALAIETATTAVLSDVAYMYQLSNTTWYRIH